MDIKIKMHSVLDTPHGKEIVCSEERESRICEAYKPYDLNMNRIVAGLMGATCYMPDTFDKLNSKTEEQVLKIAEIVEANNHHSTFGHSFVTLEISGIPKALAMVLNNEHDYNTSEKSARYTIMKDVEPKQKQLYDKWTQIFKAEIEKRYPSGSNPFFDENGRKAQKLAQENARYMISVFTPTNMVYTVSFRQLNYIAHWMEYQITHPDNAFYEALKQDMQQFVNFCKNNQLFADRLEDHKGRGFQLFGSPLLEEVYSNTFQGSFKMSFACLAQAQRHRTLDHRISSLTFQGDFAKNQEFYVPPIIADNSSLRDEYLSDISSVAYALPQGTMLEVIESGTLENFILEAKERLCSCAQKEIRDLVYNQAKKYLYNLKIKLSELMSDGEAYFAEKQKSLFMINVEGFLKEKELFNQQVSIYEKYIAELENICKGARCKSGYKCTSPCGFKEGIDLESLV